MTKLNNGGNPLLDRRESMKRFNDIVKPVFTNKGFVKLKGNSHVMYNSEKNSILITTACPSQFKDYSALKTKVTQLRKVYGNDVTIYLLYSRDLSEWSNKPTYMNTLQRIMTIKSLTGIITGLNNLPKTIDKILEREFFYNIS